MSDLASRAEALARHMHAGQTDKSDRPYAEHLQAVVGILLRRWPDAPAEVVAAAWLHDAIEDTYATFESLVDAGMPDITVATVELLSRPDGLSYRKWIEFIAQHGSDWAIRIKLADLEHNSDPARAIPGSDLVERRYGPAKQALEWVLIARGLDA